MQPCSDITCKRWQREPYCEEHTPSDIPERHAYDADSTQVRGIGVVTTRRIMVTRIKSVRRNGPVVYDTLFSRDMIQDMPEPTNARKRRRIQYPADVQTAAEKIQYMRNLAAGSDAARYAD